MLEGWQPWTNLPAGTTEEAIRKRLAVVAPAAEPAGAKGVMAATDRIFGFARAFGIKCSVEDAAAEYIRQLADYPAWALSEAINGMLDNWESSWSIPTPKQIRERLPTAMWQVRAESSRLTKALAALAEGRVETAGELIDPAEAEAIMAQVRAQFPTQREDDNSEADAA